jgi:hypothetical protein
MKGLPWGIMFNENGKRTDLDPKKLEVEVERLMGDEDVTRKSGIYEYLLSGEKDQKFLQIRAFSKDDIRKMYIYQGGIDPISGEKHPIEDFQAHHIVAWADGGKTKIDNLVLLTEDSHHKYHNQSVMTREEVIKKRDELWKVNNPKEYKTYELMKKIDELEGI